MEGGGPLPGGLTDWGWCVPGCDGKPDRKTEKVWRARVHELPVDSYVYENCSTGVDTRTEFCTGHPITQGGMVVWDLVGTITTSPCLPLLLC